MFKHIKVYTSGVLIQKYCQIYYNMRKKSNYIVTKLSKFGAILLGFVKINYFCNVPEQSTMPLDNPITFYEFLFAAFVVIVFFILMYLQATALMPKRKDLSEIKKHFIIVLGYYIGRFYRDIDRNVLNALESLSSYLETAYTKEISEKVCDNLIFQQGRIVRPDFSAAYVRGLPHKLRLQTLIILFKIAKHEQLTNAHTAEKLRIISRELFINPHIFEKTKATQFPPEQEKKSRTYSIKQSEKEILDAAALLGVQANASDTEVKKAYRKMAKRYHPDLNPGVPSEHFRKIQLAYEVLKKYRGFH